MEEALVEQMVTQRLHLHPKGCTGSELTQETNEQCFLKMYLK